VEGQVEDNGEGEVPADLDELLLGDVEGDA
jgi:hypothetical protein